jgi:hypothetical protein
MKNIRIVIGCLLLALGSCKKNYIAGGSIEDVNKYKNMSTYDVLKGNPQFDTLIRLIDTAGLKDKINADGTTFFAPSDVAVLSYLNQRTIYVQETIDQYGKFALDSLFYYLRNNVNGTRDSLLMYLIPQSLPYSSLTNAGVAYPTELAGDTAIVSYEYISDEYLGYSKLVSGQPQLVYYTHLWYPFTPSVTNPVGSIDPQTGVHDLVKTSGIVTQNGIINALDNSASLFFYGTKQ